MFAAHLRGPRRAARMRTRLSDFGVLGAAEESLTRQTLIGKHGSESMQCRQLRAVRRGVKGCWSAQAEQQREREREPREG